MTKFQTVRGMRDLVRDDAKVLSLIINNARKTASNFGFDEVITPIVESFDLLSAKSGEEIRQRMFIFSDLGGRRVGLRPEFTASTARLATTLLKNTAKPLRIFSVGSVYRYDEPQKGRYREFWQANYELMGSVMPEADAEIILVTDKMLRNVGLSKYSLKLGHVGVLKGVMTQEGLEEKTQNAILQLMDKKEYEKAIEMVKTEKCKNVFQELINVKSENVFETVRIMKRIVEEFNEALIAADNLFEIVNLVSKSGCEIKTVDPAFARGLEYYTGMIFEVYIPELEIALGGGGRYDKLIELFGGEPTPAVGVAHGLDRILLAYQAQKDKVCYNEKRKKITVIPVKKEQKIDALKIAQMLREEGLSVEFEVMGRKISKALEDADKKNLDYAVIIGKKELNEGKVIVKYLKDRKQKEVLINDLVRLLNC